MGLMMVPSRWLLVSCLAVMSSFLYAEQGGNYEVWGDAEVHHIVMPSLNVTPDIARAHQLPRSSAVGYVIVSVVKPGTWPPEHVPIEVSGRATNLLQQNQDLPFQAVHEPGAVYYIAPIRGIDEEHMRVALTVRDQRQEDRQDDLTVKFNWEFYGE